MTSDLSELGPALKHIRKSKELRLQDVASRADITKGLISRVENGRAMPSLPVLIRWAAALQTPMEDIFRHMSENADQKNPYVVIRRNDMIKTEKEDATGFEYFKIISHAFRDVLMDTFLLELNGPTRRDAVKTDGHQIVFVVSGSCDFILDKERVPLEKHDCLFFDGLIPHYPEASENQQATLFVVYLIQRDTST